MSNDAFIQELEAFKQQIDAEAVTFVKEVTTAMLDQITDTNPLDTGKCTASWTASIGSPVYNEATDITRTNRITRSEAKSRSMATLDAGLAAYQLGDQIYLSNGTNYVSKLENEPGYVKTGDGHALFVAKTQADFAPYVDSKII